MKALSKGILALCIAAIFASCSKDANPSEGGSDIKLDIPAEVTIKANATTISFNVIDGKSPKQTDIMIMEGAAGQKFCKIKSASSSSMTAELYSGIRSGQHKISIQRGLDIMYLGTTEIIIETSEQEPETETEPEPEPATGSTIYGKVLEC